MLEDRTMPSKFATLDAFHNALLAEDPLGAVVRAHIHIEERLNLVLKALTPHPKHLPSLRYEQRVKLAGALGLNDSILPALSKLGDIRNAFGHRLDVTLTDAMVDELFSLLSPIDQEIIINGCKATQDELGPESPCYEYGKMDARLKLITIVLALDKYLVTAEMEALEHQNA
jgi:hypothetical protein